MSPREASQPKTPQEKLEVIVSHKKNQLLKNQLVQGIQTPGRIISLLRETGNLRSTAEIIGYIVFPKRSEKTKDPIKSQSFLRGVLLGVPGKDADFYKLKTKIQHADHLTDHTRLAILNVLDDVRKK